MSRGRRYSDEGKLNYTKVFAVLIAVVVIAMCVAIVKNLLTRQKNKEDNNSKAYYALYTNDKWGIVDSKGNTVIEPMYQEMIVVLNNNKDIFLCTYDVNEETGEYKTKVINKDNKEIYNKYEKVEPLENYDADGNAWYEKDVLKVQKDGKYGLIDIDGKEILNAEYEKIETLKGLENSILVQKDSKIGLVNKSGATIINPEFSSIEKFDKDYKKGYITINQDKKYGLVTYAGSPILENKYEKILPIYGENYFVIEEEGDQKVINAKGEDILKEGFDKITQINSDGVVFVEDDKYGFMNYEGKVLVKPEYDELKEINKGILKVKDDKEYGIIDINDKEIIEPKYTNIYYEDSAGFYVAETENYISEILDTEFKVKLKGIISELNKENGYMKLKVDNNYKYYNFKFEEKDVKEILSSNKLFVSIKDGKYGYTDKEGNVVVDYIYDEAQEQNEYGYAAVKKNDLWGAIDSEGKEVVSPKYNLKNYLVIDFIGKWHLGQDVNMNYYCEK